MHHDDHLRHDRIRLALLRERIIENCVAEPYRQMLREYVEEANRGGGQTPHVLEKAFSWHVRHKETGSMLPA